MTIDINEPMTFIENESISGDNYITLRRGSIDFTHTKFSANEWEHELEVARRLCACWNAHLGTPTEELEQMASKEEEEKFSPQPFAPEDEYYE